MDNNIIPSTNNIITILGVDPSDTNLGISILEYDIENKIATCLDASTLRAASKNVLAFFDVLAQGFKEYIDEWQPQIMSIELPIFTGRYAAMGSTCLHMVGILRLIAYKKKLAEFGYSPKTVKLKVTGSGNAGKSDIVRKLKTIYPEQKFTTKDDHRADACAIALCYLINTYEHTLS